MNVIYTDGSSRSVTAPEAELLHRQGLIEPHPGAGNDGIDERDWKLTGDTSWDDIADAIDAAARRLLNLVLGGDHRPFTLDSKEADLLSSACDAYLDERKKNPAGPPADAMDYQADTETNAEIVALQRRLREHAGYTKRGRA